MTADSIVRHARLDACCRKLERPHVTEHPKTARRSKKAEQRAASIEQILDAAEDLFAQHGLYGVTLKEVASRVGVHHTLLNYYFSDKKSLFDTVFARRAKITSERRMKALEEYDLRLRLSRTEAL